MFNVQTEQNNVQIFGRSDGRQRDRQTVVSQFMKTLTNGVELGHCFVLFCLNCITKNHLHVLNLFVC